jgi:hypothetical protein
MNSFIRNALLGAAGLIVLSLPAHAVSPTAAVDTPLFNSTTTKPMQMAQHPRNENPGGVGFKKSKKKKKKAK